MCIPLYSCHLDPRRHLNSSLGLLNEKCPSHLEKASSSLTDSLRKSGAMVTDPPKANSILSQNKSPLDEAAAKWVVLLL